MSQGSLITALLKTFIISGFISLASWVTVYTLLAKWWRNPVGRTLVTKTILIALMFLVVAITLFFPWLPLRYPYLIGWVDVVLIGLTTPVMLWRTAVWFKLHRARGLSRNGSSRVSSSLTGDDESSES